MLKKRVVKAVDGVSFEINRGETVALVGESGCGKTTIGKSLVGINIPTEGEIFLNGQKKAWRGL